MKALTTNKIILLLSLLILTIIASLFLYHLKPVQKKLVIPEETGFVLPYPKTVKNFELITQNETTFTQKELYNHWTLLFFGFTHCASICPTNLHLLKSVYEKIQPHQPNLHIVLVSLDPERDTAAKIKSYLARYNPNFIGLRGKLQELHKLQGEFGIASIRENEVNGQYQLQHTPSIMLINPKAQWIAKFNFGLKPNQFLESLEKVINSV